MLFDRFQKMAAKPNRNFKAKWWRIARQSYYKLSAEKRKKVREQWKCWTGPRNSNCLLYVISQA